MPKPVRRRRTKSPAAAFRRDEAVLAQMVRAQVLVSGRNPLLRGGGGTKRLLQAMSRIRAVARAQARVRERALAAARVSRRDAGKLLVIDASTGRRYSSFLAVPRTRKVFVVRTDRLGRRRIYNPYDARTLARGVKPQKRALRVADFDWRPLARAEPRRFREVMTEMAARGVRLSSPWRFTGVEFALPAAQGEIDRIALRIAALYRQAVASQADHSQWQVEFNVLVAGLPGAVSLRMDPLRSYQFFRLAGSGRTRRLVPATRRSGALLRRVIGYKLLDLIRRALAERGLVSTASARRVRVLGVNRGRPRRSWRNAQGGPWAGARRREARIEGIEFRLRRIF